MNFYDSVGNEIREGDIIRMFHFISRYKRRKEYMYKQIGKFNPKYNRIEVFHLPIKENDNEKSFFADSDCFGNSVVVATGKFDPNRKLKRNKYLRD